MSLDRIMTGQTDFETVQRFLLRVSNILCKSAYPDAGERQTSHFSAPCCIQRCLKAQRNISSRSTEWSKF